MKPLLRLASLAATLVLAACASRVAAFPERSDVPGAMRLADVDVSPAARPLLLTIYPTPRRAEYGESLLPTAGAVFVDDTSPGFAELLRAEGLDLGWKDLPREGYVLAVAGVGGRAVVLA